MDRIRQMCLGWGGGGSEVCGLQKVGVTSEIDLIMEVDRNGKIL